MALGSGPRGYADWQRVVNWDGPSILDHTGAVPGGGPVSSGILEASRYGYIGGIIQANNPSVKVTLEWFLDAAGTILLAKRTLWLAVNITNPAQLRVPNLGPWVRVSTNKASGEYTLTAHLFLTNRTHPCELIPSESLLINTVPTIATAGEVTIFPTDYFAGPAWLWIETGAGAGQFILNRTEGTPPGNAFHFAALAANARETKAVILPFGPVSAQIKNVSGAEANYRIALTASLSGSS